MTIAELSEYLSIKPKTLYSLAGRKEIPHYRIKRLLRFKRSEVDEWMEGNRRDVTNIDKRVHDILRGANNLGLTIDGIIRRAVESSKKDNRKSKPGQGLMKGGSHERTT